MCGIIAYSSKNNAVDITKLRWLFKENMSRGRDATGFFAIKQDKAGTKILLKDAVDAERFIKPHSFYEGARASIALIGHTRGASVGSAFSKENAHPFEHGTGEDLVVGLHNGFVIPQLVDKHIEDFKITKKFDVDSRIIFEALALNHGDYKVLSKIEGAITVAWMMPNKYGRTIFLYRRTPRELHLGFTREGIYVSSETKPLELIGVDSVWEVHNNVLVMLHDGVLLDYVELPPPRIKSLKFNAQRSLWDTGVPQEEYEELVPSLLKGKSYTIYDGDYNMGFKTKKDKKKAVDRQIDLQDDGLFYQASNADDFGILFKDIREELTGLEATIIEPTEQQFITVDNMYSAVAMIKVVDSIHHKPIPGVMIFDERCDVQGITTITGVGMLKYNPENIGLDDKPHRVVVYAPTESEKHIAINIPVQSGRILEVVLDLPFPDTDEQASGGRDKAREALVSRLLKHGAEIITNQPTNIQRRFSNFCEGPGGGALQEQEASTSGEHKEGKTAGVQSKGASSPLSISKAKDGVQYPILNNKLIDLAIGDEERGAKYFPTVESLKAERAICEALSDKEFKIIELMDDASRVQRYYGKLEKQHVDNLVWTEKHKFPARDISLDVIIYYLLTRRPNNYVTDKVMSVIGFNSLRGFMKSYFNEEIKYSYSDVILK